MKSALSMYSSRPKRMVLCPASGSSGFFGAMQYSVRPVSVSVAALHSPSFQLVMTSLTGSVTAADTADGRHAGVVPAADKAVAH